MNPRVLRRFIILMGIATFVAFSFWGVAYMVENQAPGDYHVRAGDILLGDKKYDQALASFDAALKDMPDHRGAIMGRGIVFLQTGKVKEAKSEFTYLIDFLNKKLEADDPTGRGALAAAYANRGILLDREGKYKEALGDYINALKTDMETLEGPNIFDKVLYGTPRPSTVQKRARYIYEQLKLAPEKRMLRVPELDAQQRMYKP